MSGLFDFFNRDRPFQGNARALGRQAAEDIFREIKFPSPSTLGCQTAEDIFREIKFPHQTGRAFDTGTLRDLGTIKPYSPDNYTFGGLKASGPPGFNYETMRTPDYKVPNYGDVIERGNWTKGLGVPTNPPDFDRSRPFGL